MELGAYEFVNGELTVSYIHPGNKLATVVAFNQADVEHQMARDIAMGCCYEPCFCSSEEVPQNIIDQNWKLQRIKLAKPVSLKICWIVSLRAPYRNIIKKILYCSRNLLDAKLTEQYLHSANKELTVVAFKRVTLNVD